MTDHPDFAADDSGHSPSGRPSHSPTGRDVAGSDGRRALIEAIDGAMASQPVGVLLVELRVQRRSGQQADRHLADRAMQEGLFDGLHSSDVVIEVEAGRIAIVRAGLSAPAEAEGLAYRLRAALADRTEAGPGPAILLVAIGAATSRPGDTGQDLLRYTEHAIDDALLLGEGNVGLFDDGDRDLLA